MMIVINKSQTADTRTCDFSKVTKDQLLTSSLQHIEDVRKGISYFQEMLSEAAERHDIDKITAIDHFHADFVTGFKETGWWDNHRKISRHHLEQKDGIPSDVNLVDVIDMIVDCVMAGMGRTGKVRPLDITSEVLKLAFDNTWKRLEFEVVVIGKGEE